MADNVELDSQKLDANGDVIQTNDADTTNVVQPNQNDVDTKLEADKLLQAEYTRTRQALIDNTKKLVEKDGSEIHNITDPKLRDSVSRAIFNMGYAEAEAVFGKGFTSTKKDDDESSNSNESIQKELRLLKYREEQRDVDVAINNLKAQSPQMFQGVSDMEDKIKEELANIVSTLPLDERIRRAANNAFGSVLDSTSVAYKFLNNKNTGVNTGASKTSTNEDKAADKSGKEEALKSYMGNLLGIKTNK